MIGKIETKNGTLKYEVVKVDNGYKGQVSHDLHKKPRFNGKVLKRYSKLYAREYNAKNWLLKQMDIQNGNS